MKKGVGVEEREERGGEVATKWVGLVGPVEAVGPTGVPGEAVLGGAVVPQDLRELLITIIVIVMIKING